MSDTQNILTACEAQLDAKELELLEHKQTVLNLVVAPHASHDTQEHLRALHIEEAAVNEIMIQLAAMRTSSEFKDEANRLCGRCKELGAYTRDIDKLLSDDLVAQYRKEDANKRDIPKDIAFFLLPPGTFMTAVDHGIGKGVINVYEAAGAGVAVSAGVLFHKKIFGSFRSAAKAVCSVPGSIADSFTLFYLKETFKEKKSQTIGAVRTAGSSLGSLLRGKGFAALRETETKPRNSTITPFPKRAKKRANGVPEDKKSALG
jgi:hypothetical protein